MLLKVIIISHAVSIFYGTEIEIWAGFGLIGSTERFGADYEPFLRVVFYVFIGVGRGGYAR